MIFGLVSCMCIAQEDTTGMKSYKRLVKFPLFTTDYFFYPNSDFNTSNGKGEIKMSEVRTSFQFALPVKEKKAYLLNRIQHTLFHYNTETKPRGINETYHSFQYTIGLIQILPKKWRIVFSFSPTIASDFNESINSDDFILQSSVLAMKRSGRNFQYGFGLAYTSRFGAPTILPLINVKYKKDKWLTDLLIPAYVSHFYTFNGNSRFGFKAAVYGNLYNVSVDNNTLPLDLNRASYSRITIGPEYQVRLFGDLYLNAGAGIAVRNILEIQDDDLNTELDLNVENKLFFNIGLRILK